MHNYIDLIISQLFEIAIKIHGCFCKGYVPSSILNLSSSTFFRLISPFMNFDKLFKPLILSIYPTFTLDSPFAILYIAKYAKNDL